MAWGDVNGDGLVDVVDVIQTVNIILEFVQPIQAQLWGANCNGDGVVDILDTICIVTIILEGT